MAASGRLHARVLGAGSGGIARARVVKPTAAADGGIVVLLEVGVVVASGLLLGVRSYS